MRNEIIHYFFRCYHCGTWYQSRGLIQQKKCNFCNKIFQVKNSKKIKKKCTDLEAVAIIKYLKANKIEV